MIKIEGCYQIASTGDEDNPTSRELLINHAGKTYTISVATAEFVDGIKAENSQYPPEIQLSDNYLVMDAPLPSVDELCKKLSQAPFETLREYLIEQV